jgi:hypothetical protein
MAGTGQEIVDRVGKDLLGDSDIIVGPRFLVPRILADVKVDGCYLVEVASFARGLLWAWPRTAGTAGFTPNIGKREKANVLEGLYCVSFFCPPLYFGPYCQGRLLR